MILSKKLSYLSGSQFQKTSCVIQSENLGNGLQNPICAIYSPCYVLGVYLSLSLYNIGCFVTPPSLQGTVEVDVFGFSDLYLESLGKGSTIH